MIQQVGRPPSPKAWRERPGSAQKDYEVLRFVTLLDRDVEIIIRPKAEGHVSGVVTVLVA